MLGIAKLLPQIVPVKRETLQVVSLAMTALMRGCSPVFHIVEKRGVSDLLDFDKNPFLDRRCGRGWVAAKEGDYSLVCFTSGAGAQSNRGADRTAAIFRAR